MKQIPLTQGRVAIVDDEDFERVSQFNWYLTNKGYGAKMSARNSEGKRTTLGMHRFILNAPDGMEVDHVNGNRLDNRKENIRLCTHQQNAFNNPRRAKISSYKGVNEHHGQWRARIGFNNKRFVIGRYQTPEDAARAYDKKAAELYGEFALLNFPLGPRW